MDELKERTTYTKKSVERRDELLKAKYRDKKRREEDGE